MRAVSTVLDASLCLLLVAASAATLAGTPVADDSTPTVGPDSADETAELLATSTASVSYEVGSERKSAVVRNRTVHDTLAGLLASAARVEAESGPGGRTTTVAPERRTAFVQAVTTRVGRALRRPDVGVQVVARLPSAGSHEAPDGLVASGAAPPPDRDVHAAGFAVRGVEFTVRTWSR